MQTNVTKWDSTSVAAYRSSSLVHLQKQACPAKALFNDSTFGIKHTSPFGSRGFCGLQLDAWRSGIAEELRWRIPLIDESLVTFSLVASRMIASAQSDNLGMIVNIAGQDLQGRRIA